MNTKSFLTSILFALVLAAGFGESSLKAQSAIATLADVQAGSIFDYTLTLKNTGTIPLESLWYGWTIAGNNLPAVGVSSNPTGAIATLFSKATTTNMNTLGADVSVATAISGSGQAAGYSIFDSNPNPIFRAFLYSNGSMTGIQSDTLFPSGTIAYGMNSAGEAVGERHAHQLDLSRLPVQQRPDGRPGYSRR